MEKNCKDCGKSFRAYSTIDKYCYSCYMTRKRTGKPKYQSEPKSRTEAKKQAKKRDFYRCQLLGFANVGHHSTTMHAHHIIYLSQNGTDDSWNLITLCDNCHRLVHSNKTYWQPKLLRLRGGSDWYDRIPNKDKLPHNVRKTIEMYAAEYALSGNRGYIEL